MSVKSVEEMSLAELTAIVERERNKQKLPRAEAEAILRSMADDPDPLVATMALKENGLA